MKTQRFPHNCKDNLSGWVNLQKNLTTTTTGIIGEEKPLEATLKKKL